MEDSDDFCPVCLGQKRRIVTTPCKHTFCKHCIRRVYYVCTAKVCPLCRAPLDYYTRVREKGIKIVFLD